MRKLVSSIMLMSWLGYLCSPVIIVVTIGPLLS